MWVFFFFFSSTSSILNLVTDACHYFNFASFEVVERKKQLFTSLLIQWMYQELAYWVTTETVLV